METTIPFSGFYETLHQERLYDFFQDEQGNDPDPFPYEKFRKKEIDYASQFAKGFSALIGIPLKFKHLDSPREYNFMTDRIFCEISAEEVEKLKTRVDPEAMRNLVKCRFTSRDGFCSFYSNDYDSWLKQKEPFDHNQVGTLLECVADSELDKDWESELECL